MPKSGFHLMRHLACGLVGLLVVGCASWPETGAGEEGPRTRTLVVPPAPVAVVEAVEGRAGTYAVAHFEGSATGLVVDGEAIYAAHRFSPRGKAPLLRCWSLLGEAGLLEAPMTTEEAHAFDTRRRFEEALRQKQGLGPLRVYAVGRTAAEEDPALALRRAEGARDAYLALHADPDVEVVLVPVPSTATTQEDGSVLAAEVHYHLALAFAGALHARRLDAEEAAAARQVLRDLDAVLTEVDVGPCLVPGTHIVGQVDVASANGRRTFSWSMIRAPYDALSAKPRGCRRVADRVAALEDAGAGARRLDALAALPR